MEIRDYIQSTLVSKFAGHVKELETAGFQIKNLAVETGSYIRKLGHGLNSFQ